MRSASLVSADHIARGLAIRGPFLDVVVWLLTGAKQSVANLGKLAIGRSDCAVHSSADDLQAALSKSIAAGPRVLKVNRGSQGERVWLCKQGEGDEVEVQSAMDNGKESMSVERLVSERLAPALAEGGTVADGGGGCIWVRHSPPFRLGASLRGVWARRARKRLRLLTSSISRTTLASPRSAPEPVFLWSQPSTATPHEALCLGRER